MKTLLILTCAALLSFSGIHAQKTDPNSTPPGAPLWEVPQGDVNGRLIKSHPGNAGNKVAASNFVIIESQSANTGHNMDANWRTVLMGMGHTATIYPQTTLDNNTFFTGTDALIVSSGVIALTPTRINTIMLFMQTGKPVYIQGEYLTSYSANQAFSTVMNGTGGTFTLGVTVSGDLVPNSVLNVYSTTPNAVSGISYHWYGATGSGCNNFEYFMRYGSNNIGYVYCATNPAYGDVIQNTDQDWIRSLTSVPLMQNIVYALLSSNACTVVCGILDEQRLDVEASQRKDGSVDLQWVVAGNLQTGRFEVECNGEKIGTVPIGTDEATIFQFSDRRIPSGVQHYVVRRLDQNGAETISGATTIDLGARPARLRVATETTGFQLWLTEGVEVEALWLLDAAGKRQSLPMESLQSAQGERVNMQNAATGIYFLLAKLRTGEIVVAKAIWI